MELCNGSGNEEYFADDDIVITGISGRFPLADNMKELQDNLYNKKHCIIHAEDRWSSDLPGCPHNYIGIIRSIDKFDAEFFNMSAASANLEEPQSRMVAEVCYEAIIDSGYDPKELAKQHIGVFMGQSDPDPMNVERTNTCLEGTKVATGLMGTMGANKISHRYDMSGQSFTIDTACSSSASALEEAFQRLKNGNLVAAIVGGTSVCLDPTRLQEYSKYGMLSPTGETWSYDAQANGFAVGEAVTVIFLQKKKDARRIYAKIHNVESIAADYLSKNVLFPSSEAQLKLYERTYNDTGINPLDVSYIEGYGASKPDVDASEVKTIEEVFCKGRNTPLLLGTVKSNIGNTEASSALCSIAKVILAFETGVWAPCINHRTPNPECSSLLNGKIQLVTETTPCDKPLAAINSFGFGGSIAHMILERNDGQKREDRQKTIDEVSKLVVYAATTEQALNSMFRYFNENSLPSEFFALLNKSAYIPPSLASWRGFTILKKDEQPLTSVERLSPVKRQVWYIFTGTGCSRWPGMGFDLMKLEKFAKSLRRSAKILESFGIDLLDLLNPDNKSLQQEGRITPAFVTVVAIQIALVDVLKALDIEPDGIIGYGTGELVCSYADGCCTAEQTILSAYYIAVSVESADLPPGAMANIGLSWEATVKRCPEGVFAACYDGEDSVTVAGSIEAVEKFVEQLKAENIFANIVDSHGNAFHCKNMSSANEKIRRALQKVYTSIKPRSKRWLSTSYCEDEWNEPGCELADANYYCHNLESEVHFREVLTHVPDDAIIIEIGQHFQLQSTVKKVVRSQATYIELLNENVNNVDFLLKSIGKLYNLGLDPQIENLYETVPYPVSRGTPMISPLIKWDHSKSFHVAKYQLINAGNSKFLAKTSSTEKFLLDHCIEGRSLYPATGYVYLAWKALCQTLQKPMDKLPICIENFKILRATILNSRDDKIFHVRILHKCGDFEISEGGSIVATGRIFVPNTSVFENWDLPLEGNESCAIVSGPELYNELKIHGYEYGPAFQGLLEVSMEGSHGLVKWNNEWISFLDSLLLFFGIIFENSDFKLPTGALSITIDPVMHMDFAAKMEERGHKGIPVRYDRHYGKCVTPGVEIRKLKLELARHRTMSDSVPVLEEYSFVPYDEKCALFFCNQAFTCESYIHVCNQLAKQIVHNLNIKGKMQSMFEDIVFTDSLKDQEFYFNSEENSLLLKSLRNVMEMALSSKLTLKIEEECQSISNILSQDLLFRSMLSEKPLRSLLDVAAENCVGKMTITEWCDSSTLLLPAVQEIMKLSTLTKSSYTLIHSNTAVVDTEDLSQRDIQVESAGENDIIPSNIQESCHLGVTCCLAETSNSLKSHIRNIISLTNKEGFILVIHKHELIPAERLMCTLSKLSFILNSETEIENIFQEENLVTISKKSCSSGINAYLLRKLPEKRELNAHVVKVLDGEYDQWVEDLKEVLSTVDERGSSDVVLLVAQDTVDNGIVGFVNCLKQEPGGDKIRCIFTDSSAPPFDAESEFYGDILRKNLVINVYKDGTWGSFRNITLNADTPKDDTDWAYVECIKPGDLTSLLWLESPIKRVPNENDNSELYHVYYSSLNFKDVMIATGRLSAHSFKASGHKTDAFIIGFEFSGRERNGRRVMAMVRGGSICNTYNEEPIFKMDVPDKWSLEEAATVPVVYSTSYYALILQGELQHGEKILIHSGAGGVGQAAIRIALSMGCEIFTTVGTPEKKEFLMKTFPQLKPENIGCSRDSHFEEMIIRQTEGEGVDVVLNSLADDKLQASIRCLGYHGRFLEIGKYDLQLDNALELQIFLKGISFISCQMDAYYQRTQKYTEMFAKIRVLMNDGIQSGVVQPLDTTVFQRDELEKAFRYMGSGKHIGKVLIKVREEEAEKTIVPPLMKLNVYKTFGLYGTKSYIIVGGLGGFGIELAKWLVQKGAGTVILTSRYGARTPYHHFCLRRWEASGARVIVSTLDVSKRDEAQRLLQETRTLYAPIGGIFNSAVVLKDAFIENQSASAFEDVCAPKALATKNLDELTRTMCPDLDIFVCFSSISCGKGNAGQTNYGYANSVMERICEKRKQDGLHGLAIEWGIIGDVGLVHRRMGDDAMIAGVMAQRIRSCLECLEKFLLLDKAVVSSFVTADKSKMKKSLDDVLTQIAKLFGVSNIEEMNPYRTLGEMGIDSMVGVELRQLLQQSFDTEFTLQQIRDMKIDDIKTLAEDHDRNKKAVAYQAENLENISIKGEVVCLTTEPVVRMNGVKDGEPVFVIHGNDLSHGKLKQFYEGILHPVFALHSSKDTPMKSLKDMSLWYLEQISRICPGADVHLVSISSSGILALEMAFQSENQKGQKPNIKSLTILDGSLQLMETYATTEQEKQRKAAICETSDLCEFLSLFSESDLTQLKTQLELLPTLESRVNMISNLLTSSHKLEISEAAEFYTKKQNLMRFHSPSGKLQRDLTIIEAAEKVLPNDVSAVKSFMEHVCSGRVTIRRVVGNCNFLVEESSAHEVATILNKCLNRNTANKNVHLPKDTVGTANSL